MGNFNLDTDEQKEWYSISTNRSSEHLGDCLDLMPLIADESIDMILCDLPYGTTACSWDEIIPFDKLWMQYNRIIKPNGAIVLFSAQPFTTKLIGSNIKNFKHSWVWNKELSGAFALAKYRPMIVTEDICVFSNAGKVNYYPIMEDAQTKNIRPINVGSSSSSATPVASGVAKSKDGYDNKKRYPKNIINYSKYNAECNQLNRLHPTQKPEFILEYLIKTYTNENEVVLDNTAGVFSTAVACLKTNRKYIVMEKEKEYYNKGLKRILEWEREQKTKLF